MQGQRYTEEDITDEEKEYHFKVTPEQREAYTRIGGDMSLDRKYTVFGEVTEGFDVIEKIAAVKIHQTDKPVKKILLTITMLNVSH
jgi:cyclophilin family peptidyl-prolyl cis-trans isomerase